MLVRTSRNFGLAQSGMNQRTERDPEAQAAQKDCHSPLGHSMGAKRTLDGSFQAAVAVAADAELRMKAKQRPA